MTMVFVSFSIFMQIEFENPNRQKNCQKKNPAKEKWYSISNVAWAFLIFEMAFVFGARQTKNTMFYIAPTTNGNCGTHDNKKSKNCVTSRLLNEWLSYGYWKSKIAISPKKLMKQ